MSDEAVRQAQGEPHAVEGDWHRPWLALGIVAGVGAMLGVGLLGLPTESAHLPAIAEHAMQIALPTWGSTEAVNEIVYGSRGWDTFGETFLLLAAVITVSTLARSREPRSEYVGEASAGAREQAQFDPSGPGADQEEQQARSAEDREEHDEPALDDPDDLPLGLPAPERAVAMTVIVRVAARIAAVPLAVTAVYLAAWGYTPGGGFPAGAALVGVVILLYTALGHRMVARVIRPTVLEPIEIAGAVAITAIGIIGLVSKGSMFANWVLLAQPQTIRAGGTTQLYSGSELVEVATGLTIAIFALLGMEHDWTPDSDRDSGDTDDRSDAS